MNYRMALERALEAFRQLRLEEIAGRTGYGCDEAGIWVDFLGKRIHVSHPEGAFKVVPDSSVLPEPTRILILHYLVRGGGVPEQQEFISFKELPGGMIYIEPFTKRAINPFTKAFGTDPERFLKTARLLGGTVVNRGDAAAMFRVFPKIPVTLVLWKADEEFPASATMLFDRSAPAHLETEDYAVLASMLVRELIERSRGVS